MGNTDLQGIIPRTFDHIFNVIGGTPDRNFLIRASFLELYNEEVRDLLCKNYKNKLELRENPDAGVYIKDLSNHIVQDSQNLRDKLAHGKVFIVRG
jgi:kinesin family protein 3/17